MPIPQFLPNLRLNPGSSTNNEKDNEVILENRVISVLKAMEKDHGIQFTSSKGTNKDKWIGFQQKVENLSAESDDFKNDPRVAYLKFVGDQSKSLQMRLESRPPTAQQISSMENWKAPNQSNSGEGASRPSSPTGSEASNGSNVGPEHGGRRTRHKRRRATSKRRRHYTGKRYRR